MLNSDLDKILTRADLILEVCQKFGKLRMSPKIVSDNYNQKTLQEKVDANFIQLKSKRKDIENITSVLLGVLKKIDAQNDFLTHQTEFIPFMGEIQLSNDKLKEQVSELEVLIFLFTTYVFTLEIRAVLEIEDSIKDIKESACEKLDLCKFQNGLRKSMDLIQKAKAISDKYTAMPLFEVAKKRSWRSDGKLRFAELAFANINERIEQSKLLCLNFLIEQVGYHFHEIYLSPNKANISFTKSCMNFVSEVIQDEYLIDILTVKSADMLIERIGVLGFLQMFAYGILKNKPRNDQAAIKE